jgi:hypothetical protein
MWRARLVVSQRYQQERVATLCRLRLPQLALQCGHQRAATLGRPGQIIVRLLSQHAPTHAAETERALARIVHLKKQLNSLSLSPPQQAELSSIRRQLQQSVDPAQRKLLQAQETLFRPDAARQASIAALNQQIEQIVLSLKAQGISAPSSRPREERGSSSSSSSSSSSWRVSDAVNSRGSINDAPAWAQPKGQSENEASLQRLQKYQLTAELEALNWKVHELTGEQSARRAELRAQLAELGGPLQLSERVQVINRMHW